MFLGFLGTTGCNLFYVTKYVGVGKSQTQGVIWAFPKGGRKRHQNTPWAVKESTTPFNFRKGIQA